MRKFNIHGNNETSEFDLYCKSLIGAMETESSHGSHERRNSAGDYDSTNSISHATYISTKHIIKSTIQILEKDVLKKGVDFKVP